mmetsp:Transcript_12415/g.28363  ORF Transcript_12415/g.28363 Transcript_12415/m.28363 type:complete len:87 (+) Transcript_12415:1298-1558(+)
MLDEAVIEVFSSQVCVPSSGFNLEDTLLDGQERHIESSSTKVEDEHVLFFSFLIQAICDGGCCGLVDDSHHIEARDGSCVLSGLAL